MKAQNRIKKQTDFQRIIHSGNMQKNQYFIGHYEHREIGILKVGIAVSKKNGNAVIRNKIKRQTRMMVREISDLSEKIDLIIIVRASYDVENYEKMKAELERIFSKIRRKVNGEEKI